MCKFSLRRRTRYCTHAHQLVYFYGHCDVSHEGGFGIVPDIYFIDMASGHQEIQVSTYGYIFLHTFMYPCRLWHYVVMFIRQGDGAFNLLGVFLSVDIASHRERSPGHSLRRTLRMWVVVATNGYH